MKMPMSFNNVNEIHGMHCPVYELKTLSYVFAFNKNAPPWYMKRPC